jgi:hypothetical protein
MASGSLHISRDESDVCVLGFSCFRMLGVALYATDFMVVSATFVSLCAKGPKLDA